MRDELTQWKKRINKTPLPILKSTAQFFAKTRSKPGASISGLWSCLQHDPGMCLHLLRAAGRSKSTKVTNLNHAILLLGLPNTLNRTDNLPKIEDIKDKAIRNAFFQIYSNNFHIFSISNKYFHHNTDETNKELEIASFLTGFIDYLICSADPARYLQLIKKEQLGAKRLEAEESVLGLTRRELAFEIATDWQLPEMIIQSQKHSQNQSPNLHQVSLTLRFKEELSLGWYHQGMQEVIEQLAESTAKPTHKLCQQIHQEAVEITRNNQNLFPVTASFAERLVECEPAKIKQPAIPIRAKKTRKDFYEEAIQSLEKQQQSNYQDIINECFNGFHKGLGFSRMFFAVLSEDKKHLKIILSDNIAGKDSLNRLLIPLNNQNLFEQIMRQPGGVWMNKTNHKKYLPFLPMIFLDKVRSHNFMAMSVFIHEHPFGLFFADMNGAQNITEGHFKYFKHLCRISSEALEALSDRQEKQKIAHA